MQFFILIHSVNRLHSSFAQARERHLWVAQRWANIPDIKGNTLQALHPLPVILIDQGMERMWSKRVCNFLGISVDAACTRLISCEVLNLNIPALGETTILHYLAFVLKMKYKFPIISVRNTKNSRNCLFCQSDNFYNYKFPCPGSPPPTHLTGIFLEQKIV